MSVIWFWSPAMWSVVIRQIRCKLNRNVRTRMSCSATRLEQHAMHCTQLTVGLLSLKRTTRFSLSGPHTCSIMSHKMTSPANSRSKFVIFPFGFESEITSADMSGGHLRQKTVGLHLNNLPIMTPPTPWLDASTTPTKSGQPATSLRQRVGCFVDSLSIVWQFEIAEKRGWLRRKYTTCGCFLRSWLHGDNSPWPPRSAVNACCSFATTDSNSLKGTPRSQFPACIHAWRVVRSFARFCSSSHIVFCCPLKSNPRSVLNREYCPSPFRSFFSEMGLFPSMMSAGKMLWIQAMIALPMWVSCSCNLGITMLMKSSTYTSTV
jgi:hypothetical protein